MLVDEVLGFFYDTRALKSNNLKKAVEIVYGACCGVYDDVFGDSYRISGLKCIMFE